MNCGAGFNCTWMTRPWSKGASLVEGLRKTVGGDLLDFAGAIQPYQPGPKSFRTKLTAPPIRSVARLDVYAGVLPKGEVAADFFEVIPVDNRNGGCHR